MLVHASENQMNLWQDKLWLQTFLIVLLSEVMRKAVIKVNKEPLCHSGMWRRKLCTLKCASSRVQGEWTPGCSFCVLQRNGDEWLQLILQPLWTEVASLAELNSRALACKLCAGICLPVFTVWGPFRRSTVSSQWNDMGSRINESIQHLFLLMVIDIPQNTFCPSLSRGLPVLAEAAPVLDLWAALTAKLLWDVGRRCIDCCPSGFTGLRLQLSF